MNDRQELCGCKGIRTCLVCEKSKIDLSCRSGRFEKPDASYSFCWLCNIAWLESNTEQHPSHQGKFIRFPGVTLIENVVSEEEEEAIIQAVDATPWKVSQSGRRKQDYGPKVNFKKRKVNSKCFSGLPAFIRPLTERLVQMDGLADFQVVEQCNLEYVPDRGSSIDPHFDDVWLWGERLVTLNLNSETTLTMTQKEKDICVSIPLPKRSVIVLYGPARYEWMHAIHREDIINRRIAVTFRELSAEFLDGGVNEDTGSRLLEIARTYEGKAVQ
ncbi:alpha-ketoglutarate-dependent dioxygenase alkB homolog 4-like [Saccoglossus kowalevskii]|uniref:Alpha-ketoglutarate-dependent dioxygenase alkB homolog 4-like n=1 Tax=Saccoglossus kowalevskii TaxID=10224 RepID=A0ABM0MWL6_SACKO|nr:PREDICTED: alpha-ketoglutarate-dependent dioxygenase alkB homolog 4-like [Saccoglossus kowalevskii]